MKYFVNIATMISQIGNVIIFKGHPDQTISARSYVNRNKFFWSFMYKFVNKLFFWQKDHCYNSHLADVKNAKEILDMDK